MLKAINLSQLTLGTEVKCTVWATLIMARLLQHPAMASLSLGYSFRNVALPIGRI